MQIDSHLLDRIAPPFLVWKLTVALLINGWVSLVPRDFHSDKKFLDRLQFLLVNLIRSTLPQAMKRKFVRILFVVLATFAVFSFAYPDDLSDDDSSCTQIEMLHVSRAL